MHEKSQNCYDNNPVNYNQVMSDQLMRDENTQNRCVEQDYKYMKYSDTSHINLNHQTDQIVQNVPLDSNQNYPEHLQQYFYNNYQQHNMLDSPQQQFISNYNKEYLPNPPMNHTNIENYSSHCDDSYITVDELQRYQQQSPSSEHILRQSSAPPMTAPLSTPSPPLLPPNSTVIPRIKQEEAEFSVILADVRKTCYSS